MKRRSCEASWRSASFRPTSACVTPARTSERDWAWVTSGSTSARTSPAFTTAPSRTLRDHDAARDDRFDVHLRLRVDDADLADADLKVFGLDLAEPEGRLVGSLALVLAAGREDDAPSGEDDDSGGGQDPLELLGHARPRFLYTKGRPGMFSEGSAFPAVIVVKTLHGPDAPDDSG